jgi:hypothetical protein
VLIPTPPAITNAIYNAVGVRVDNLPVDQEKLLWAMQRNGNHSISDANASCSTSNRILARYETDVRFDIGPSRSLPVDQEKILLSCSGRCAARDNIPRKCKITDFHAPLC